MHEYESTIQRIWGTYEYAIDLYGKKPKRGSLASDCSLKSVKKIKHGIRYC